MGKSIREKLHSQRGASLMLALLLFLICAVVGSIVLTAATTTNRVAFTADMDRQYYAVTSAARLLRDQLRDDAAQVEITFDRDGNTAQAAWLVGSGGFARYRAKQALEALQSENTDEDLQSTVTVNGLNDASLAVPGTDLSITPAITGLSEEENAALAVTGTVGMPDTDPRAMTVTLQGSGTDPFTMKLYFVADILKEQLSADTYRYTVTWTMSDVVR